MRILVDTSVLVAAVVQKHICHEPAFAVLRRVQDAKDQGLVAGHSLAEMYAVLTKLPAPFRHTPEQALLSIEENVLKYFQIPALTGSAYAALIREAALTGIQGVTIYDAILLKTASKAQPDRVYTFDVKHFRAVAPQNLSSRICSP